MTTDTTYVLAGASLAGAKPPEDSMMLAIQVRWRSGCGLQ